VHALKYLYGVQGTVYGVTGGFHGFASNNTIKEGYEPVILTNELVENIHHVGGTVLRSSRGGFDIDAILDFIRTHQIQQLYLIGGDGTHRAAYVIHQACQKESLNVAVAGIPKVR
jgi:6-phosphofructokinase 1